MTINGRIAILRQREGLSQKSFGRMIDRSEGFVSKLESGKIQPTDEVISHISNAFGVDEKWLREGKGALIVTSLAERIRTARKAYNYTQEELADDLGCSRNTIGLIERGLVRPGEELIQTLVDTLWINKIWLLTGQGKMQREELTAFYELLRKDLSVRQHIKRFIEHLDRPVYSMEEKAKQEEQKPERMIIAQVNDAAAARLFFDEFNIPYEEVISGPNAGKLKVRPPRRSDKEKVYDIMQRCRRARIPELCDHANVFRDCDDNTIVTFSPYDVEEVPAGKTWIEMSEHSIYGLWTKTFVVRC